MIYVLTVVSCVWANPCQTERALRMEFSTEPQCRVAAGYVDKKSDSMTTFFAVCTPKVWPPKAPAPKAPKLRWCGDAVTFCSEDPQWEQR